LEIMESTDTSGFSGPPMNDDEVTSGYQALSTDEVAELEAADWIEGTIGDVADCPAA
jgi:hypothetical protein